jgi:hypothetical protein
MIKGRWFSMARNSISSCGNSMPCYKVLYFKNMEFCGSVDK